MYIINKLTDALETFGKYLILMGRTFSRPERLRMYWKQYVKEMSALGVDSIGIVLLISFFTSLSSFVEAKARPPCENLITYCIIIIT